MTRSLRDHRRHFLMQLEISVLEQETANPAEVDRWKEILQVKIEDPSAVPVLSGVCNNRPLALEAVCSSVLALLGSVDFVDAVLKEVRQPALQELQGINRCLDGSLPARHCVWEFGRSCISSPPDACTRCTRRPSA